MDDRLRRKLSCLLVDDDRLFHAKLAEFIRQTEELGLFRACADANEAKQILALIGMDLIFIDITTFESKGRDLMAVADPDSLLILLSHDPEQKIPLNNPRLFDCLMKPLTESRFQLAFSRIRAHFINRQKLMAYQTMTKQEPSFIVVRSGNHERKLNLSDILYLEANGEYINYHTVNGKWMVLGSLKEAVKMLAGRFVRIHRSYAVNGDFVTAKTRNHLELIGGQQIPIGKTYKNAFRLTFRAVLL